MKLKLKILIVAIASILSSIAYRCGGSDSYNTKVRDMGVAFIGLVLLLILYNHYTLKYIIAYFLTFGLYFGALTTYFKKKGTEAKWFHWFAHGLGMSLAFLPFALVSGLWLGFALRCVVCPVAIMIWSEIQDDAVKEELGRGFLATITIPLLLI